MAGRPVRRARMNSAAGRPGAPVTLNELKLIVGPLRSRFPDAEFDVDEERAALRTRSLFYNAPLRREIQQYLQARSYVVIVTDEEVDEIGDHGYPTGYAEPVTFFRLGHAHATTARSNPGTSRSDWMYLAPLFADVPMHKLIAEDDPDYVSRVEDVVSLMWGRRALDALPLATTWLRSRGVRLVERLGYGTFGSAYLTDRGTVVKLSHQAAEYEAARALQGLDVANVVHVFDTAVLGRRNGLDYFLLEVEYLRPPQWSLTEKLPEKALIEMRRGCHNYKVITGKRCDMHRENFGLNKGGECTLLDLGPDTGP